VGAELFVWVDEEGRTHITDDLEALPEGERERAADRSGDLGDLWEDGLLGSPTPSSGDSSRSEDRVQRSLRTALDDLRRGETARATVALEGVLRQEPGRPEPHYYLALLDRERGRFDSAEAHLRAFLTSAGDDLEPWRQSAQRRLRALEAERRLTEAASVRRPLRLVDVPTTHFRIQYDSELAGGSRDYPRKVARFLEEARSSVGQRLAAVPSEPLGVVLYGKAAYLQAHRHRFSFQTVGFFDGRIHVVSAAHPAGELRKLLFHEYTHALFRERTGGDRPFWLNEGLAEISEREPVAGEPLTRSERARLRAAIESGRWIPLDELRVGFSGFRDEQARLAYLESTAAAAWIEARTQPRERARLLEGLGRGIESERVLSEVVGVDTLGVDAAVRQEILAEFAPTTF
jgi:hypothetical protein